MGYTQRGRKESAATKQLNNSNNEGQHESQALKREVVMVSRATQRPRFIKTVKKHPLYLSMRSSGTLKQGLASYGHCLSLYDPPASSMFFSFLDIKYTLHISFILAVMGLCCCARERSLIATSKGSSQIVMLGLLIVVASLAARPLGSVGFSSCNAWA